MILPTFILAASLVGQGLLHPGMKNVAVRLHCVISIDGKFKENWDVETIHDFLPPHFVETKTRDGKTPVIFNVSLLAGENGDIKLEIADQTKAAASTDGKAHFAQPLASLSFNLKHNPGPISLGAYGTDIGPDPQIEIACERRS